MNKYIGKYRKIVNKLIEKSFPKLKGKRIVIKEKRNPPYRARVSFWPWGIKIMTSDKIRGFSDFVIRRIMVHELCHIEIFLEQGFFWTNLEYLPYLISPKVRKRVESKAIILMIKKEYSKGVISAYKDNMGRGLDYALSLDEIKTYIKKLKK